MKVEIFFGLWVFLLEIGWIIYGNTFVYDDNNCEKEYEEKFHDDIDLKALDITTLVLIIYGYFLLLGLLFWLLYYLAVYCGWKEIYAKDQTHLRSL